MSEPGPRSDSELRISPHLVNVLLVFVAVAGLLASEGLADLLAFRMRALGLLLMALSALSWALSSWKPPLGKWSTISALAVIVALAHGWMGIPGTWALMAIPAGLAAALISFPASLATALSLTVLIPVAQRHSGLGIGWEVYVALTLIWATLGLLYAVYRPVQQYAEWTWRYYEQAQNLLEEARDHRADLQQALSDFAHANRQIALTNERLAAMRQIAEEAQKTKAAFVAKVSHEFRTPLNMIIGLVDLLMETPEVYGEQLPQDLLEDLQIVHRNCEHLSSMINDVLDLSQAEAGRLALHRERVDLLQVIEPAVGVVRPLLDKKRLTLRLDISSDLPAVYCDRTRIRQVILNLVSNAARFTERGGITVRARARGEYVVVDVIDTGPGISPEDAERIFEPFCQGTSSPWRDRSGSGLGLSISKQFVELHGGRIWLDSTLGQGTTFSFDLPVSPPMEPIARPERWIREDWVWLERTSRVQLTDTHYKPRLVICDETGYLHSALAGYSGEVEFVDVQNLDQVTVDVQQCPAHAVILNVPSPDGLWPKFEQARARVPNTPLVGCSVPPAVERALEAGAAGYLIKPVARADLEATIRAVGKPVKRVLVVDDSPDVVQLLTRMLYTIDRTMEVITALNGEEALERLRAERPDLVLLDVIMPDLDGWQVLERANQEEGTTGVPIVFISAQDPAELPSESPVILTAMGEGLSLGKMLACSLAFSSLLLNPD